MPRVLEICVDSPAGLAAAITGGADRVELCSALALGGLTPSPGLVELAASAPIPVMAMIRPRAGGFEWSPEEVAVMESEIAAVARAGLAGVVIGATRGPRLDLAVLDRLVTAARGLDIALHRCVDLLPDPLAAVDAASERGFSRILSSGGARTAILGLERLRAMQDHASGRLAIMPGAGISETTLPGLLASIDPVEVHASASRPAATDDRLTAFGFQPAPDRRTDAATVAALKRILENAQG